jgi:hypothetical protein
MLECAECLASMVARWDLYGTHVPVEELQLIYDSFKRYCSLAECFEGLQKPKQHMVLHMLREVRWFGNVRLYATWVDESLNKDLKKACRGVSSSTFEVSVLSNMRGFLQSRHDDGIASAKGHV